MLDTMRMRTACFARAPQRCTSRLSKHFLLTFQEVTPLSKTRNQLTGRIRITPKADAEEKAIDRHERSGEEKPGGRFSERCPWFTFSPVILAHILAGDNNLKVARNFADHA